MKGPQRTPNSGAAAVTKGYRLTRLERAVLIGRWLNARGGQRDMTEHSSGGGFFFTEVTYC